MRGLVAAGFVAVLVASAAAEPQRDSGKRAAGATLTTLTGCVSAKPDAAGTFTFTQAGNRSRFRLIGKSIREYAGKPVEIVSASGKGLSIRGGLVPSPNVAAQAGHMDSARAAIASQPGVATAGKGDAALPEFRVSQVRAVEGSCE